MPIETEPSITFPVIRGLQARREYFVAMWTLRMLRQISIFDEDELPRQELNEPLIKHVFPRFRVIFWTTQMTMCSLR